MVAGACALDICAHGHQQSGHIDYFRLAGAILHQRIALRQNRRHEQVFRAGHGNLVENNMRAMQSFGASFQVAVFLHDGRAHRFQAFEMQIDRAVANGATARLGHAGKSTAGDQRTQNQRRSTHGLDDLVLGSGVGKDATTDGGAVLCPAVTEFDLGAHRSK